jgi:hypothetical protein
VVSFARSSKRDEARVAQVRRQIVGFGPNFEQFTMREMPAEPHTGMRVASEKLCGSEPFAIFD